MKPGPALWGRAPAGYHFRLVHNLTFTGPIRDGAPGGNLAGTAILSGEPAPKRLQLLRELIPDAVRFGVLAAPANVGTAPFQQVYPRKRRCGPADYGPRRATTARQPFRARGKSV
jgi:hypothetical protein